MSSLIVDDFTTAWEADPSGLWTLSISEAAGYLGGDGLGMSIVAQSGAAADPPPFAERQCSPPLDLSGVDELRFWFRSARPGDGKPARPFYLAFEITSDPPAPGLIWTRLLAVKNANTWEMQQLWLGDMPANLRQAAGFLRLRSLDPTVAFNASIDDLIATTPQALQDADAALLNRLDLRFTVEVSGTPTEVPASIAVPEHPVQQTAPYILITPWSVQNGGGRASAAELIDNYTADGAFLRPSPWTVQLEYQIDVFVDERFQKTQLLEAILGDFSKQPFLVVAGEPLMMTPFVPAPQYAPLMTPGRTPLFYRLSVSMEAGARQFRPTAVAFLVSDSAAGASNGEVSAL